MASRGPFTFPSLTATSIGTGGSTRFSVVWYLTGPLDPSALTPASSHVRWDSQLPVSRSMTFPFTYRDPTTMSVCHCCRSSGDKAFHPLGLGGSTSTRHTMLCLTSSNTTTPRYSKYICPNMMLSTCSSGSYHVMSDVSANVMRLTPNCRATMELARVDAS